MSAPIACCEYSLAFFHLENHRRRIKFTKNFLRLVQELEKLITYTGTPTVVWRRTGEICAVGEEFCLLTEWKRETLLTGSKHIYEVCKRACNPPPI